MGTNNARKPLAWKCSILAMLIMAATGCTTVHRINTEVRDVNTRTEQDAARLLSQRASQHAKVMSGPIISDLPYVATTPVPHAARLPPAFRQTVTLNEAVGVPVDRLVSRLEAVTGIRVMYESGMTDAPAGNGSLRSGAGSAALQADSTATNMPPLPAPGLRFGDETSEGASARVAINYTGDAKGLFDAVAGALGGQWKWEPSANRVRLFTMVTETFRIAMVPGGVKSMASVGQESGSTSSDGGSKTSSAKAETTFETDGSLWEGLEETLKQLISPAGSITVSESLGTVTVRDRWDRVDAVRDYIEETNESLSRQVEVDVRVYRVQTNDSDNRGVNWNIVFNALQTKGGYGINLLSPRADTTGDGVSSAILAVPPKDRFGNPQKFGGSQLFLDALNQVGRASVLTSTSVQTVNNQPAPVKIVQRRKYLATVAPMYASSAGSAVGAGAALTPGEVETGFKMQILPHVQDDGKRVLLQIVVSLSTLDAMETQSSGGETIQLPQVSSREFMQRVWLTNGQALVLAGFENVDASNTTSSPFDKTLWGLAGNRALKKSREAIVIVITPAVSTNQSKM